MAKDRQIKKALSTLITDFEDENFESFTGMTYKNRVEEQLRIHDVTKDELITYLFKFGADLLEQ